MPLVICGTEVPLNENVHKLGLLNNDSKKCFQLEVACKHAQHPGKSLRIERRNTKFCYYFVRHKRANKLFFKCLKIAGPSNQEWDIFCNEV